MNQVDARKILGVSAEAQFPEVRSRFRSLAKRFHPDNPATGDAKHFALISSAYVVLQGEEFGLMKGAEDVSDVLNLQNEIDLYLSELLSGYRKLSASLLEEVRTDSKAAIFGANSSTEVRKAIESPVARSMVDARVQLEHYVKNMAAKARSLDGDFLFNLFGAMYRERRRYWLLNLYRNPALVAQGVGLAAVYFLRNLPTAPEALVAASRAPWLPLAIVALGASVLAIQYFLLNPKRQFVPPAASLPALHSIIKEHSSDVGTTSGELAGGGAVGGAVIGTFAFPGIGTLIGAGVGALLGLTGKSLDRIKQESFDSLMREFEKSLRSVDRTLEAWVESSKKDLHEAAVESFQANARRIAGLLTGRRLKQLQLTSGQNRLP